MKRVVSHAVRALRERSPRTTADLCAYIKARLKHGTTGRSLQMLLTKEPSVQRLGTTRVPSCMGMAAGTNVVVLWGLKGVEG